MDILYISSSCSEIQFDKHMKNIKESKNIFGMPVSSNKFHSLIIKGLSKYNKVTSLVGRPISNDTHDKLFWGASREEIGGVTYKYIAFINIKGLKQLCIGIGYYFNILCWLLKRVRKKTVIIYDAAYVNAIPAIFIANKFLKTRTIAIFADIYDYMWQVDNSNRTISNFFKRIIRVIVSKAYNKTDKYIFLSIQMNELINKFNKPYYVMEGISDSKIIDINNELQYKNKKDIIMYAGALREEYGLKILTEGFMKYKNDNAELWIFGNGVFIDEILKASNNDERIKYGGILDNEEILKKETEATLLINPRPTKSEFTKYSFPSKLIEYMASGTAVLTTKLPTIPKEYNNYLFFIEGDTEYFIAEALNKVISIGRDELHKFGMNARKFIIENKCEEIQARKILM